jgi:hypothetical protein
MYWLLYLWRKQSLLPTEQVTGSVPQAVYTFWRMGEIKPLTTTE